MKSIERKLCSYELCSGCMACFNACAFDAIEVKEDSLGMLRPYIRDDLCRNCGRCTQVCPGVTEIKGEKPSIALALYTNNLEDRRTCSSGGVATTLSRTVIDNGGCVFGAGYDKGNVLFKKATTQDELEEFKGSKYVFSNPGLIYREVEKELKAGKFCMFIGTPCQVDGLKHYLGKAYDNLITIDLICHGTPPYKYLEEHMKSIVNDVTNIIPKFRGEDEMRLKLVMCDNNNVCYVKRYDEDIYFHAFLNGIIHREPCYKCRYANIDRVSDITIGDFWGLDKNALGGYDGRISVALLNTQAGKEFFHINEGLFSVEVRKVEEAVSGNAQLRKPSVQHKNRKVFCDEYIKSGSFIKAASKSGIIKEVKHNIIWNRIMFVPRRCKRVINNLLKR